MIAKKYLDFMKELNKNKIDWCLIKDYEYLMKNGYDNEIDLVAKENDRNRIRKTAVKEKWNESALNSANTHLIFWKFEGLKPFRVDIHLGKALATAVPWIKVKDILNNKIKHGEIYAASPAYELTILLLSSFRGRESKSFRIKRAKELKEHLNEAKTILRKHLTAKEIEKYYELLIKGKIVRLSNLKRIGIFGFVKKLFLLPQLILCRLINSAKVVVLSKKNSEELFAILAKSKINVKKTSNPIQKYFSDIIIKINKRKGDINVKKIIYDLYGEK